MSVSSQPQHSLYETELEDTDLEKALEEREKLNDKKKLAVADFNLAHDKVKALIAGHDLGQDAPVRVGRFVLVRTVSKAREVSFTTEGKAQLRIRMVESDA